MSMISGGDERVRSAFRANLLEEPSRPNVTQELDASDILEVNDLAHAIERAEKRLRTPAPLASGGAEQGDRLGSTTDDASGPAVHAPARQTPVPLSIPPTLRSPLAGAPATLLAPVATPLPARVAPRDTSGSDHLPAPRGSDVPPAVASTAGSTLVIPAAVPNLVAAMEEDAYFHPGSRIRGLADESLQIYRPEPTLLVRARARRRTVSWALVAAVPALLILAAAAIFLRPSAEPARAFTGSSAVGTNPVARPETTVGKAKPTSEAKPSLGAKPMADSASSPESNLSVESRAPSNVTVSNGTRTPAAARPSVTPRPAGGAKPGKAAAAEIPLFDVNSLPSARTPSRR